MYTANIVHTGNVTIQNTFTVGNSTSYVVFSNNIPNTLTITVGNATVNATVNSTAFALNGNIMASNNYLTGTFISNGYFNTLASGVSNAYATQALVGNSYFNNYMPVSNAYANTFFVSNNYAIQFLSSNGYSRNTYLQKAGDTVTGNIVFSTAFPASQIGIVANNSIGTYGQILTSNGAGVYWGALPTDLVSNSYLINLNLVSNSYLINSNIQYTGNHSFVSTSSTATNTTINSTAFAVSNSTITAAIVTPIQTMTIALSDEVSSPISTGVKITMRAPYAFKLVSPYVRPSLTTSGSSTTTVDILSGGTSIFATPPSLTSGLSTNLGPASMSATGLATIADDTQLTFSLTAAGTGAAGLKVNIYYVKV